MLTKYGWSRVALAVILVSSVAFLTRPQILGDAGLDFWSLPGLQREIDEIEESSEELGLESETAQRRIAIKDQIIVDLADGQIDLLQAATLFRNLESGHDDYFAVLRFKYADMSDDERLCRNVLDYAATSLAHEPTAVAIMARLNAEFERIRQSNHLHLPG